MVSVRATSRGFQRRRALTLIELLVVVAILAILMGILLTTLGKVRESARSVLCKNKLQTVAQRFQLFADDFGHPDRGRESAQLGDKQFRIEDFQDSIYGTEEFYRPSITKLGTEPIDTRKNPLVCPDGPRELSRINSPQPAEDTIAPLANVSVGFNMRLHRASVRLTNGNFEVDVLRDVTLTARILDHPWTPLAFDVDGASAQNRPQRVLPFYSAPPVESAGLYASGKLWFPSARHGGMVHAAFIGGHVWSARRPASAPNWDWGYQPPPDE